MTADSAQPGLAIGASNNPIGNSIGSHASPSVTGAPNTSVPEAA